MSQPLVYQQKQRDLISLHWGWGCRGEERMRRTILFDETAWYQTTCLCSKAKSYEFYPLKEEIWTLILSIKVWSENRVKMLNTWKYF